MYVGSSKDIYTRWSQHKHDLRRHTHRNVLLQRAWDKYGEDGFVFDILERTAEDRLLEREQFWYEKLHSFKSEWGYNLSPIARSASIPSTEQDLIDGKLAFTREQFDSAVDYLCNTDLSVPAIAEKTGIHERSLYQMYFKTQYKELTKDLVFRRRVNTSGRKLSEETVKEIVGLLSDGNSLSSVARRFDIAVETVRDIHAKKTWKHLTKDIDFPVYNPHVSRGGKPVMQFTKDMEYIATYRTAREAQEHTGVGYRLISQVCTGEKQSAHGYIFRFASDAKGA